MKLDLKFKENNQTLDMNFGQFQGLGGSSDIDIVTEIDFEAEYDDNDVPSMGALVGVVEGVIELLDNCATKEQVEQVWENCEENNKELIQSFNEYKTEQNGINGVTDSRLHSIDVRLATKHDTLVSGGNLKTINGQSVLGEGNLSVSGGSTEKWVELLNTTLTEDVAYVDIVAPDGKMLKKLNIHINTDKHGLTTASKVIIKGSKTGKFSGSNGENLVSTQSTINTYSNTVFFIEKGSLFPFAFSSMGGANGGNTTAVYMGGVTQLLSTNTDIRFNNAGPWKTIRIQSQAADVLFKARVKFQVWGVYE